MKIPKRAKRSQEVIDNLVNLLEYYMGGTDEFRRIIREDVQYLEDYLIEISEDHKLHNIKLATKLKGIWKKDMEKKDKEIKKLKKELDDSTN